MRASGATLVEVGTTNKTRLADYAERIADDTAVLLKVHRSNFAIVGFTEDVAIPELAAAGRSRKIPVMVDLGSGALEDLAPLGLPGEPTVAEIVRQGADLVTFSGDKLLGGPQAARRCAC
jgi:L-seryl-tRNA(Ser) seleniumtransferase